MILLIDNYDSFTYNLAQIIEPYANLNVLRNDAEDLEKMAEKAEALVFSPGPGWPSEAGKMEAIIRENIGKKPMLGICLGHQAIIEVLGGKLRLAPKTLHGKESDIQVFNGGGVLFREIPETTTVMRYHSIVADGETLPKDLRITARSIDDGEIQAVQHKKYPVYGLQFHPESIGTPLGEKMVQNFITKINENNCYLEGMS